MKRIDLKSLRQTWSTRMRRSRKTLLLSILGIASVALATPPLGFIVNQILAKGVALGDIRQQIEITRNPDGSVDPWEAELHTHGATDFYMQHLVLAPGGYSGWHSHPGILIGTVTSGSIDFYDSNCQKHTVNQGDVYFENGRVHGIINQGSVNADLSIAYLIKHNAPRRLDPPSAPDCAASTPIP